MHTNIDGQTATLTTKQQVLLVIHDQHTLVVIRLDALDVLLEHVFLLFLELAVREELLHLFSELLDLARWKLVRLMQLILATTTCQRLQNELFLFFARNRRALAQRCQVSLKRFASCVVVLEFKLRAQLKPPTLT